MIDAIAVEILERDDVVAIVRDESFVDREAVEEMLQEFGNYEAWDYVADNVWEASREAIHDVDFSEFVDVDESILDMLRSYIRIKGDDGRTDASLCRLGKAVEEAIELTVKQYAGEVKPFSIDMYEDLVVRMSDLEQQVQVLSEALATAGERASSVRQ